MSKRLLKSVAIYGTGSVVSKIIGLLLVPMYTRFFSPDEFGKLEVITTVTIFLGILGMLQIESAVARFYYSYSNKQTQRQLLSTALLIISFFSVLVIVISFILIDKISLLLFGTAQYSYVMTFAFLAVPFTNIFSFFSIIIRFENRPVLFSIITLVQALITLSVAVWCVMVLHTGIVSIFYAQLAGSIFASIVALIFFRKLFGLNFAFTTLKEMLHYSIPTVPGVGISYLQNYSNRFVMLTFLSTQEIGLFSLALKIASVFTLIEYAFRMAWYPFFWETFNNPDHRNIFKYFNKQITLIIFALVIIFVSFSETVLNIIAPPNYWGAKSILNYLGLALALNIIVQIVGPGPDIQKKTYFNSIIYSVSTVITIGLLFLLVPHYKLMGVVISQIVGIVITISIFWVTSERLYYIGFDPRYFLVSIVITIVLASLVSVTIIPFTVRMLIMCMYVFGTLMFLKRNRSKFQSSPHGI